MTQDDPMNTTINRPNPKNPLFIAIEGLDGSGKSTLSIRLAQHLDAVHLTTPMQNFPGSARRDAESMCADDPLARMLFYASTVAAASTHIRGLLEQGRSVVVDRYWLSTLTYHLALGTPTPLADVEAALIPADLTIFLDVSMEVRRARLSARGALQEHDRMTLQPGVSEHIVQLYRRLGGELQVAGRFQSVMADALSIDQIIELVSAEASAARTRKDRCE